MGVRGPPYPGLSPILHFWRRKRRRGQFVVHEGLRVRRKDWDLWNPAGCQRLESPHRHPTPPRLVREAIRPETSQQGKGKMICKHQNGQSKFIIYYFSSKGAFLTHRNSRNNAPRKYFERQASNFKKIVTYISIWFPFLIFHVCCWKGWKVLEVPKIIIRNRGNFAKRNTLNTCLLSTQVKKNFWRKSTFDNIFSPQWAKLYHSLRS